MILIKKKNVLQLFAGWVDFAARKDECPADLRYKMVYRAPEGKVSLHKLVRYGHVEKNTATLTALLARDTDPKNPLVVYSTNRGQYVSLAKYLEDRAERKAKKIAQAEKTLAKLKGN